MTDRAHHWIVERQGGRAYIIYGEVVWRVNAARDLERENAALRAAIDEHNRQCDATCDARAESGGSCAYRERDGTMRYHTKRCIDCPVDWKIDMLQSGGSATGTTTTKEGQ